MDAARIEGLHESATSRYLQGDLEGARAAWLEVLTADPGDERALEGIRLCEQSLGAESESVCTSGRSPFAVGSSGADDLPDLAAAFGNRPAGELDLSEISDELEEPQASWTSPWQVTEERKDPAQPRTPSLRTRPAPSQPSSSAPTPAPVATPLPAKAAPPAAWQFGEGAPPTATPDKSKASAPTAAEVELRRRVNELIAEALRAVENGDTDGARRTVSRILILDEQNETALSLLSKIGGAAETEVPEEPAAVNPSGWERHVQDPELAAAQSLGLDRPPARSAPSETAGPPLPAFEGEGHVHDHEPSSHSSLMEDEPLPDLDTLLGEDAQSAPPEQRSAGRRLTISRRTMTWAAGGLLALAVVAGAAWFFLKPDGDAVVAEASTESSASREERRKQADAGPAKDGENEASKAAAATRAASPEDRFRAAMARAELAQGKGDFAALVVALAEALKARPEDAALRERFDVAAAKYRVKQENDRKWQEALDAFKGGNYSHALTYFYRVPADDPRPQLERYKLNGWFNLGLVALRAGDCKDAKQHLTEARQLSATDSGVKAALELAHRCTAGGDAEWATRLEAFRIRGLDD